MAKQRQSAVPAAVMHLAKPRWQANSRAMLRALLPANSRTKVMPLVQQPAKLPFLELQAPPQDWLLPQVPKIPLARVMRQAPVRLQLI